MGIFILSKFHIVGVFGALRSICQQPKLLFNLMIDLVTETPPALRTAEAIANEVVERESFIFSNRHLQQKRIHLMRSSIANSRKGPTSHEAHQKPASCHSQLRHVFRPAVTT